MEILNKNNLKFNFMQKNLKGVKMSSLSPKEIGDFTSDMFMTKPKVLLRFDVEDYITPMSNDALQAVLEILHELEIKATFVLVGEKVRMLLSSGATTILDLLQNHALGYHSYLHSFHPLANEYLQNKDWQDGINEFLGVEEPGHRLFVETFDQPPICYTQPGADWVPQAFIA